MNRNIEVVIERQKDMEEKLSNVVCESVGKFTNNRLSQKNETVDEFKVLAIHKLLCTHVNIYI